MYRNLKLTSTTGHDQGHSRRPGRTVRFAGCVLMLIAACLATGKVHAFRVTDASALGYGITRWDAAPHVVDGVERSLDGGLRYSIEGGSYEAYLDQFRWEGTPPGVGEFQAAIEQAFAAWEALDPASGLGTALYFVPDLDTPVFLEPTDNRGVLNRGSEIDLFAVTLGYRGGQVNGFADLNSATVTLTSGLSDYPGAAYLGFDVLMSIDSPWPSLSDFKQVLTHEIGHAIGLGDVDVYPLPGDLLSPFYDDNFDDTNDATALATLTNSFAHLIDPNDPDHSPGLMLYEPCNEPGCTSSPGFDSPGVNIMMEATPQQTRLGLQHDDFAGRQFLYPFAFLSADFNRDGNVDGDDFLIWQTGFNVDDRGDADGDGGTDGDDFLIWQAEFAPGSGSASAAVPEPTAVGLLIAALVGVACLSRQH